MKEIYKLLVSHDTFEPSTADPEIWKKTGDGGTTCNAELIWDPNIRFLAYEDDGVKLCLDHGRGHLEERVLHLWEAYCFSHCEESLNEEGFPQEFRLDYCLCLLPWDEAE